jgi:RimJ/RimL family protein N-acetyltransferase
MSIFLETSCLVLRRFTEADEDNLVELDSDPEVMRFLNGGEPTSREEVRGRILPILFGFYERYGYRLRRSAWGKGYATEGSRALIHKGFTDLGVDRVAAETMVVNLGSRRVMEKAGLTLVRTFHRDELDAIEGFEHGVVEYALTRADWEHEVRGVR